MKSEKIRKDIHLSEEAISILQAAADKESRTLKNYIEKILVKHSDKIKNGLQQAKS
jgi:hypothetical protein